MAGRSIWEKHTYFDVLKENTIELEWGSGFAKRLPLSSGAFRQCSRWWARTHTFCAYRGFDKMRIRGLSVLKCTKNSCISSLFMSICKGFLISGGDMVTLKINLSSMKTKINFHLRLKEGPLVSLGNTERKCKIGGSTNIMSIDRAGQLLQRKDLVGPWGHSLQKLLLLCHGDMWGL